jgi:hypothetical protein
MKVRRKVLPITVTAVNDAPDVSNNRSTQQLQYSDQVQSVAIWATDADNAVSQLRATSSWKVGATSFASDLPSGLAFTQVADGSWLLSGKMMVAPGTVYGESHRQ